MPPTPEVSNARYTEAWNELDAERRLALLADSWADTGVFVDPEVPEGVVGREALSDYIRLTQEEMPGLIITPTADPESLGGRLRTSWVAVMAGSSDTFTGTDFIEFAEDGRIAHLTMFYDSTPG